MAMGRNILGPHRIKKKEESFTKRGGGKKGLKTAFYLEKKTGWV